MFGKYPEIQNSGPKMSSFVGDFLAESVQWKSFDIFSSKNKKKIRFGHILYLGKNTFVNQIS